MSRQSAPDSCAQCGASLSRQARACPECGADERTGWRESSIYDGLELPETAFDEDPAVRPGRLRPASELKWYWIAAAALLLLLLGLAALGLR